MKLDSNLCRQLRCQLNAAILASDRRSRLLELHRGIAFLMASAWPEAGFRWLKISDSKG